jgi:hypothetical protein
MQFFVIAAVCSFAWYILPGYLFATITSLSWVCWTWKDSIVAHQIGSGMQNIPLSIIHLLRMYDPRLSCAHILLQTLYKQV